MPDPHDRLTKIVEDGSSPNDAYTNDDIIECADGTELSVVAGGGTHSTPRPVLPGVYEDVPHAEPWVEHDYPGPYTEVDVLPYQEVPPSWDKFEEGEVFAHVPVQMVRDLIDDHDEAPVATQNE